MSCGADVSAALSAFLPRSEHILAFASGTCSLRTPDESKTRLLGSGLAFRALFRAGHRLFSEFARIPANAMIISNINHNARGPLIKDDVTTGERLDVAAFFKAAQ